MLKFSGYPYLIRGQFWKSTLCDLSWSDRSKATGAGYKNLATPEASLDHHCVSGGPREADTQYQALLESC